MSLNRIDDPPLIGIIMLDTVLPRIPGDIGNPKTFPFPVLYNKVFGASSKRVVIEADAKLLQSFINAAQQLEKDGVKSVTTSCGFLSIFQQELSNSVDIPVFSSSLIQAHLVNSIIRSDQKIGIVTAVRQSLTQKHLIGVDIERYPLVITGMDKSEEFRSVFVNGKDNIDMDQCCQELLIVVEELVNSDQNIGAIILECTNMSPFSAAIQNRVGLPVFDIVTLIDYIYSSLKKRGFCSQEML